MRKPFLLIVCLWFGLSARAEAPRVTVSQATLQLPTYVVGPDDKNPALHNSYAMGTEAGEFRLYNSNVFPYPMQTDVTRRRQTRPYRAVVLENRYVRVIVLPELGGRVYAAHDKTNGDVDFIYHNHVIKPSLVGLRGAWISGGIEWNFPTRGHSVNTFSPVNYRVVPHDDGSVSCFVGTIEWVRRMRWSVEITLWPDRSVFRDRITLFNRTLTHNRAYYWTNAAVHAWNDTRVTFPPTDYTFAGMRRRPEPWPMKNGVDVSWYRNTPSAHDFFCGTPGDYHGAYHYEHDFGTVHTASGLESPGQKFWTWGTAPSGQIWEKLLTDDDGQYIEVQAGRLLTQGDTWIFEPHMAEKWDEYWYPIKQMQGFVKANANMALNAVLKQNQLAVSLNATRIYHRATIEVSVGGKNPQRITAQLNPVQPWKKVLMLKSDGAGYCITVRDDAGNEIIRYRDKKNVVPPPVLESGVPDSQNATAEETYVSGYYAWKHWHDARAERLFQDALAKDPGFTPALLALAMLRYKAGHYEEAFRLSTQILNRNEDDQTARYYQALCKLKLGLAERTADELSWLSRRSAYRHVAPYASAGMAIGKRQWQTAERLLRGTIRENANDVKARVMLAAVLRHRGRRLAAKKQIDKLLLDDPISTLGTLERRLQGGPEQLDLLADDPQYYLEGACDYAELNLREDAVSVLEIWRSLREGCRHPMIEFYLGFYADRAGRKQEAARWYGQGVALATDGLFPFRKESIEVLRAGLHYRPDDWKLHYYLGTVLTGKGRWHEGFEHFVAAGKTSPQCSVLYANLGAIHGQKLGQIDKARDAYERAAACDPNDYHYYLALDRIYVQTGESQKHERLFLKAPKSVRNNFRIAFAEARFEYDRRHYDTALKILKANDFLPWEGRTDVRQLYGRVLHSLADQQMEQGHFGQGIEYLEQAMEYPENLGVGMPHDPDFSIEYFKLGLCYQKLGNKQKARRYLRKVIEQRRTKSVWYRRADAALREIDRQ